jgi:hypothetical protein
MRVSVVSAPCRLDPELPPELVQQLLHSIPLGPDSFAWYQVDRASGNVLNQGAHLAVPMTE